ncbi:MAG: hypothetical protein ABIF10_05840 [Candidatus Woesearchaeota archaeon]
MLFPKVKKTVQAFLTSEDGRISKKKLVAAGVMVAAMSAAAAAHSSSWDPDCPNLDSSGIINPQNGMANHANNLAVAADSSPQITGTHSHCVETHSSHESGDGGGGGYY